MSNKVLGRCACPLCGCPDQEVRESTAKSPKPYLCCEDCQVQIFARGAKSSRILKQRIAEASPKATVAAAEKPAAHVAPVATKPEPVKSPAAAPVAPVVAAVVEKKTEPAEKTIFDWLT